MVQRKQVTNSTAANYSITNFIPLLIQALTSDKKFCTITQMKRDLLNLVNEKGMENQVKFDKIGYSRSYRKYVY